jgi:hypothetical protein
LISGSFVETGSSSGSGIGSGASEDGISDIGALVIMNCTVSAESSRVGSGYAAHEGASTVDRTIVLDSCSAVNSSLSGSALGSGDGYIGGISRVATLTLWNSTISATSSGPGAGIGSGWGEDGASEVGELMTVNCIVTAESLSGGCGIGSGDALSNGRSSCDHITIMNSSMIAGSGSNFPMIGS